MNTLWLWPWNIVEIGQTAVQPDRWWFVMFGLLTDMADWFSLQVLTPTQHLWQPLLQAWMDWRY